MIWPVPYVARAEIEPPEPAIASEREDQILASIYDRRGVYRVRTEEE